MKVRIGDQSLRIRLTEAEAKRLSEGDAVRTRLQLNAIDVFTVELTSWNLSIGEVHFGDKTLLVSIPVQNAQQFTHQQGYSYQSEQQVNPVSPLKFSVEIDLEKASQP
jgi:hypothetical protein